MISFVCAVGYGIYWVTSTFVGLMGQYVPLDYLQLLVAIATLVAGSLLFRVRCRYLALYGVIEIIVGILFAGFIVNHLVGNTLKDAAGFFTIAGAIYIIVRGYDNIYRSQKWGSRILRIMNPLFFGRRVYRKL
jgi:hypothetical protein